MKAAATSMDAASSSIPPCPLPPEDAALVVDVQRDFCPGGALAVPEGDAVVPAWNDFFGRCRPSHVYATRDWHPPNSRHFQPAGPWPPHCVAGSPGADFHPGLRLPPRTVIISKGVGETEDGYSGFDGRDPSGESLAARLHRDGVRRLWIGGLATDYCVRATAAAALENGFEVLLLTPAMRGINAAASRAAIGELQRAGAHVVELPPGEK